MVFYPIQILVDAGIDEILLVTGGNCAGHFLELIGNGADFGLKHFNYTYQQGHGGIAEALRLAEHFVDDDKVVVVLGDNIIERDIRDAVERFEQQERGARIFLKEVPDPQRFGVPELDGDKVTRIVEKPKDPPSPYAVIGIYMYDKREFEIARSLKPSGREELEITDVNNAYLEWGEMKYEVLDGWWTDAGTFDSLVRATALVAEREKRNR